MDTQQNYEIWMIGMEEHPVSMMYMRKTLPSWKKRGYDVKIFNAITPKDLYKKHKLNFGTKLTGKVKREFTETEKAVWYSHFELWCKCFLKNKPVLIIEHDSKLVKPLPDLKHEGYKVLSYIDRDFGEERGNKVMAPGSGYYITPIIAQRLITSAVVRDEINQNSDGHIATYLNYSRQNSMEDFYYIEQINIDGLNTIDHKNPDRNYVGLDYEKIDIPSIHGQEI